jgi:hypothetical protein
MRTHGVDIIGKKLLFTQAEDFSEYVSSEAELRDVQLKIELMALICLRYLYSVERNRKAFRLVFPPEIFGPFIDIGNYEKNWERYDNTLQKISQMDEHERKAIHLNFREMRNLSSKKGES